MKLTEHIKTECGNISNCLLPKNLVLLHLKKVHTFNILQNEADRLPRTKGCLQLREVALVGVSDALQAALFILVVLNLFLSNVLLNLNDF